MHEQTTEFPHIPWVTREQLENRQRFPLEQLVPYLGKYVAWNHDNTAILACDEAWDGVWDRVEAMGLDPRFTAIEYIGE